jgi:outer membrane receptor for Fe3+-dicitrate
MRYSLKLTNRLTDNLKVTGNLTIDDGGKLGGWNNKQFSGKMKYFNEGAWANKQLGLMGYFGWTHTLSAKTFYDVKVSNLTRVSEFGYSDDNGDGKVSLNEDGGFIIMRTTADVDKYMGVEGSGVRSDGTRSFFSTTPGNDTFNDLAFSGNAYRFGGPGFYYEELNRDVFQVKADLTSQINFNHQIKTGVLYRNHTVSQFQQQNRIGGFNPAFPYEENEFSIHPKEYALYVQDRIEYEGIIINAGMRLDGFDSGAKTFSNIFDPSVEETLANGHVIRRQVLDKDIPIKWTFQPRLGISHPITDNAAMHYSWGKFYSPRSFSSLYENYGVFSNPSLPATWDAGADPYGATAYEIGLQYGFSTDYLVDVAIYYRDIENYTTTGYSITPAAGNGFGALTYITSFGYADSRGFELALEKRPGSSMISGRVNYAYSYIKQSVRSVVS